MYASNFVGVFHGQKVEPLKGRVGILHVVPGSFNPVHDAHRWMYESIDEESTIEVKYSKSSHVVYATSSAKYFEISTSRFGKESLSEEEILNRARQFSGYAPVLVTTQSLFINKYEVLKPFGEHIVFHIGMDTYERLMDFNGSEVGTYGCFFCVWPRSGSKLTKGAPKNCYSSGIEAPPHLLDLSSTKIRQGLVDASGKKIST